MSRIIYPSVVYEAYTVCLLSLVIIFCLHISPSSCDIDKALLCSREYCSTQNCTKPPIHCTINNATHGGKSLLDPSFCNCCEYCLVYLLEGDECSQGGLATPPTGNVCGPGLSCQAPDPNLPATCQRMKSHCHSAQDSYDERRENGTLGATEQRPECDEEGLYRPRLCLPGQTCFCQSEEGQRIFGEVLNENDAADKMLCGCSRAADRTRSLLSDLPMSLRCRPDGSYDPMQCIGRRCFCVNPDTGILASSRIIDLMSQPLTDLPCFDRSVHYSEISYHHPCEEELYEMKNEIAKAEAEGYSFLGNPYPKCQPDGWFESVMTLNDKKICVDKQGNQIKNYEGTTDSIQMDCKCARTEQLILESQASSFLPTCCPNGNWKKVQCRRGSCFCVDSNGVQQGMEVDINLVDTLPCNSTPC